MRITMKALCALPTGALEAGKTYDVHTARAKSLISGGYAVPADEDPATGGKRKPARKKTTRRKGPAKSASGESEGSQEAASSDESDASGADAKDDSSDEGDED